MPDLWPRATGGRAEHVSGPEFGGSTNDRLVSAGVA
jgi:hypothetical protein